MREAEMEKGVRVSSVSKGRDLRQRGSGVID